MAGSPRQHSTRASRRVIMRTSHLISGVVLQVGRGKEDPGQPCIEAGPAIHASTSIMVGTMNPGTNTLRKNSHSSALDRTDIAILGLLQNNARLSVKEIAAEVGLAPSSTHERIRRRWDAGVLGSPYRDVDHL